MTLRLCMVLVVLASTEAVRCAEPTPFADADLGRGWPRLLEGECYAPQPGDIILFRHRSLWQNFLYNITLAGGVTHAGIVVARPNHTLAILEAPRMSYPVLLTDIPSRVCSFDGRVWVRRRRRPLSPDQSACLTAFACAQEGKGFDIVGLLRPMIFCPVRKGRPRCLDAEELDAPRWICSTLVVAAGVTAGLLNPCLVRPKFTDPEDLMSDYPMDLSRGWESAKVLTPCGPRLPGYWSESCDGHVAFWH